MSMRSLLQAVNARIQSVTSLGDSNTGVQIDGRPPNFAGELYIATHPGGFQNEHAEALDEYCDVFVTVSRRAGYVPGDRVGQDLAVKATTGLYARAEVIRAALHSDYVSMNNANAGQSYSIGAAANGFVEPLRFRSCSQPKPVGPEWFGALPTKGAMGPAGYTLTLAFARARRVQTIESMT